MSTMKLSVIEKLGFGAGDMAVNIVMITMQLIIAYFPHNPKEWAIETFFCYQWPEPLLGQFKVIYLGNFCKYLSGFFHIYDILVFESFW